MVSHENCHLESCNWNGEIFGRCICSIKKAVEKTHAADKITGKTVFWKDIEISLTSFENVAFWSKLFSLFLETTF